MTARDGVRPSAAADRTAVALVDGEHYPPVVRGAIAALAAAGTKTLAALVLGGTEKVAAHGADIDLGAPATWVAAGRLDDLVERAAPLLDALLVEHRPDVVLDLSDEPVIDDARRFGLAAHALAAGVPYEGPDFRFDPPPRPRIAARPSIAVIGTGKRLGKTAVTGELVRRLVAGGRRPVIVAMGRGGPEQPVVVPAGANLGAADLLAVADGGGHAASDFYEDALTTGVATVGARRCGGGLAGAVGYTNLAAAIAAADALDGDIDVLEGSGASVPPAHADATVLVVPADLDRARISGSLVRYRVLLADLALVMIAAPPTIPADQLRGVLEALRSTSRGASALPTVLQPVPLAPVSGARVFLATTAAPRVARWIATSLESRFGCHVVATSSRLADRPGLVRDLTGAPAFEVLLVELKAAAVDVAARIATEVGAQVVFCDNRPVVLSDDGTLRDDADPALDAAFTGLAELAAERHAAG